MAQSSRIALTAAAVVVFAGAVLSPSAVATAAPQTDWGENAKGLEVVITNNSSWDLYLKKPCTACIPDSSDPSYAPDTISAHTNGQTVKGKMWIGEPSNLHFMYFHDNPSGGGMDAAWSCQVRLDTSYTGTPLKVWTHGANGIGCTFTKSDYNKQLQLEIHNDNG